MIPTSSSSSTPSIGAARMTSTAAPSAPVADKQKGRSGGSGDALRLLEPAHPVRPRGRHPAGVDAADGVLGRLFVGGRAVPTNDPCARGRAETTGADSQPVAGRPSHVPAATSTAQTPSRTVSSSPSSAAAPAAVSTGMTSCTAPAVVPESARWQAYQAT